jgi:hypothetical protein
VVKGTDVSSIVTEDVSARVCTKVSEAMRVVSDTGNSVELGLGRHAPALTARREMRATKPMMKFDETILTSVMIMESMKFYRAVEERKSSRPLLL